MKTYSLSKADVDYLHPIDAVLSGLNSAIQVYIINVIYKRLSIPTGSRGQYNLEKGELMVFEEADMNPPKGTGTPDMADKLAEKPMPEKPGAVADIPEKPEAKATPDVK